MKPIEIRVRGAEPADIAAIAAIYGEAVVTGTASYECDPPDEAEMARRWRALTDGGYPYIVAERGGELAGYAYAGPFRSRPAYRYLVENTVYVARTAQRLGIGRVLLTRLVALCEDKGFRQMVAVIGGAGEQTASVRLHEALGFHVVGLMEGTGFKHGRWLDTLIMQRPLGPGRSELPPVLP